MGELCCSAGRRAAFGRPAFHGSGLLLGVTRSSLCQLGVFALVPVLRLVLPHTHRQVVLLRRYELRAAQPGRNPRTCLGGSCMAFCPAASAHEEASLLLVGTEGGQLLRCQVGLDS